MVRPCGTHWGGGQAARQARAQAIRRRAPTGRGGTPRRTRVRCAWTTTYSPLLCSTRIRAVLRSLPDFEGFVYLARQTRGVVRAVHQCWHATTRSHGGATPHGPFG